MRPAEPTSAFLRPPSPRQGSFILLAGVAAREAGSQPYSLTQTKVNVEI